MRVKENEKPVRTKCKYCSKEMCALVARMKKHLHTCNKKCSSKLRKDKTKSADTDTDELDDDDDQMETSDIEKQIPAMCKCKYITLN